MTFCLKKSSIYIALWGFFSKENKYNKIMGIKDYIKETRAEFKHVNWPTKKQAIAFTLVVILISLFVAYYLGLFDYIFSTLLKKLLTF